MYLRGKRDALYAHDAGRGMSTFGKPVSASVAVLALLTACGQQSGDNTATDLVEAPPPPACVPSHEAFEPLIGSYDVVSVRAANVVDMPDMEISPEETPFGAHIDFTRDGPVIANITCECWQATDVTVSPTFAGEPQLLDIRLQASGPPRAIDGAPATRITCNDEELAVAYRADDRVITLSWETSSATLLLEKPLPESAIRDLQSALKTKGTYTGEPTGVLDQPTIDAVHAYMLRLEDIEASELPARPVITRALLGRLGVTEEVQTPQNVDVVEDVAIPPQ